MPKTDIPSALRPELLQGAVLFSQRCAGCHTLSYAATHGSAANIRTAQANNGPNFNVRCERPVSRVLYAIQNGGFSGAIMPQNVVVGQQAIDVAYFVAYVAGRQAPPIPGVPQCVTKSVGTIPAVATTATSTTSPPTSSKKASSKRAASARSKRVAAAASTAKRTQSRTHVSAP